MNVSIPKPRPNRSPVRTADRRPVRSRLRGTEALDGHAGAGASIVATVPATLEYATPPPPARPGRRTWPWVRFGCLLLAVAYPALGLLLNAAPDSSPGPGVPVDWQNGRPLAWATLVTVPPACVPVLPLLAFGWAAAFAAARWPREVRRHWLAWAGLGCGLLMGLQFTLVVALGETGGGTAGLGDELVKQVGGGWVVATAVLGLLAGVDEAMRWLPAWGKGLLVLGGGFAFMVAAGLTDGAVIGAPVLAVLVAAPMSAVAFTVLGVVLWHAEADPREDVPWRAVLLAWAAVAGLNGIAWLIVRPLAWGVYRTLPTEPPDSGCFVATAAARSSTSARRNHRQARTLRAFESMLIARSPALHGRLRRIYNIVGPRLADRLTTPRRAAVAHALLRPIESAARRSLRP